MSLLLKLKGLNVVVFGVKQGLKSGQDKIYLYLSEFLFLFWRDYGEANSKFGVFCKTGYIVSKVGLMP